METCSATDDRGRRCCLVGNHASVCYLPPTGDTGTADHPHGPTAYADAIKGMDPLTAKIHALKAAELSLTAHTQGAIARRAEIRALKAEVAKLYFETLGKKPRERKAGK